MRGNEKKLESSDEKRSPTEWPKSLRVKTMPLWGGGALIQNATICTHRYMGNFSEFGVSLGAGLGTAGGSQRTCSHTDTVSEHSNCTQGLIPGLCESNLQPATSVFQNLKLIFFF